MLTPDLGSVRVDPGQVEQVLMNLVINARDAMPQGGKLTLETNNIELGQVYAKEHTGVAPGRYVMVAVTDTGSGMDAATLSRVFEPFFTTRDPGKGTGLGLSTAYGIVNQSGGHIWVYSEPGVGTTFKVYFPRVEQPAEVVRKPVIAPVQMRGTETVLVVEDDSEVRQFTEGVLTANGYSVLAPASTTAAESLSLQYSQPIHLLLTDVVMPVMGGRELARRVTAQRQGIRVLYMSGYTDNAIVHHGALDAGIAFLPKPFSPQDLLRKIRQVLDGVTPGNI